MSAQTGTGYVLYAPQAGDNAPAISALLAAGNTVKLIPGQVYGVQSPVAVPDGTTLTSDFSAGVTGNDFGGVPFNGAILRALPPFVGAGVITFTASSATAGRRVAGLFLDCTPIRTDGGNHHGIYTNGPVYGVTIDEVTILKPSGYGLFSDTSGGTGDSWRVYGLKVSACMGAAGILANMPDTWWIACESSENLTGDGWLVGGGGGNQRFIGCKGENNAGYGWNIQAAVNDAMSFTDCGAQINNLSGWFIHGGINNQVLQLANCRSVGDAVLAGATDAGLKVSGAAQRVQVVNFVTRKADNNLSPAYGVNYISASFELNCVGCYFEGVTAATHDDASNTHALVNANPMV